MIDHYRRLLDDPVRVAAFEAAIEATIRPGDVVLDLGCALGNFSIFACRAGAARVYAVEAEPVIETARRVVAANGFGDVVTFLQGRSTALEPPERARVAIFEDYATTLLSPGVVETVRDAVARWLEPGGTLLPGRARIWLAAVEDASGHREIDRFAGTGERAYGIDVSASRRSAFGTVFSRRLNGGALLSEPALLAEITLADVDSCALRGTARVEATRTGVIHGLLLWFELELADRWLGTGPLSPPTAWHQPLFPLEQALPVDRRDPVDLALEAGPFGSDMVWRWSVGTRMGRCEGSNLESVAASGEGLARWDPDHVPEPDADARLVHCILGAADGRRSLEEIAAEVRQRFPDRLTEQGALERRILRVLNRRS